jgi:FkbM family methyltransferase
VLTAGAVCYCVGAGEDISFDLSLATRFRCEVWMFDPTPRAIAYVSPFVSEHPNLHFEPLGVWSSDTTLRFYAPRDPRHVSHSAVNLQRSAEFFDAECRSVASLMRSHAHERLAVLKLDIEGAEYEVLEDVLTKQLPIDVICVEFDQPMPVARTLRMVRRLRAAGYALVRVEGLNCCFVGPLREPALAPSI